MAPISESADTVKIPDGGPINQPEPTVAPPAYQFMEPPATLPTDKKFCSICFKEFKSQSGLTNHLPSHDTSPRFTCSECGAKFFHSTGMSSHKRKLH